MRIGVGCRLSIGLVAGVLGVGTVVLSSRVAASSGDREGMQRHRYVETARGTSAAEAVPGGQGVVGEAGTCARGPKVIRWRSGRETPPPEGNADLREALTSKTGRHVVVQLEEIPTAEKRASLDASGVKLLRYVGGNSYFAKIEGPARGQAAAAAIRESGVIGVVQVKREHKLHPMLLRGEFPDHARFRAPVADGKLVVGPRSAKAHRLPDAVMDRRVEAKPDGEVDALVVYVLFHPDVQINGEAVEVVHNHGGVVRSVMRTINAAVVWVPQANLDALAAEDAVQWIEPALPALEAKSVRARPRALASDPNDPNFGVYGLEGNGVTVMLYDCGPVHAEHPDLAGRVVLADLDDYDPNQYQPNGHATAMAGIIAGNGTVTHDPNYNTNPLEPNAHLKNFRGVASEAVILSYVAKPAQPCGEQWFYTDPGDLEHDYVDSITWGAEVISNSVGPGIAANGYSCEWEGDYSVVSMLLDALVRGGMQLEPGGQPLDPMRVILAAGNERTAWVCGDLGTVPPPATAKNVITVGASFSNRMVGNNCEEDFEDYWWTWYTGISSWGPTDDGRVKPDLSAPGQTLWGAFIDDCSWYVVQPCGLWGPFWRSEFTPQEQYYYGELGGGTSSACAFVCGLCGLILEDFKGIYPNAPLPRNSTLKALLTHHAEQDKPNEHPGPDYLRGYGYARLQPAIDTLRAKSFLEDDVDQGQERFYYVSCPADANALAVTVAWDDVPGALNTTPELVNDLDLVAISPSGVVHYPWTLDPNDPSLFPVQTQPDHVNNIEQIAVQDPEEGIWTIRVTGYSVPCGPQPYSAVFTPEYQGCSSKGEVLLDAENYGCQASAEITVMDCDLNTDANSVETTIVSISSPNVPSGQSIVLTETGANTARFAGMATLEDLLVGHGDEVTVTYRDSDDGSGNPANVQNSAEIDCQGPEVTNVGVRVEGDYVMSIVFDTDEPAIGIVHWGLSCAELTETAVGPYRGTSHAVQILGTEPNTTYYYKVEVVDDANNVTMGDNGGECYHFASVKRERYFAQFVEDPNDFGNYSILFRPDGSNAFYTACTEPITELPVDPDSDEWCCLDMRNLEYHRISLGVNKVWLYGQSYGSRSRPIYISRWGFLTFAASDTTSGINFADHFRLPRVSAYRADLRYENAMNIQWRQTNDRLVVMWWNPIDFKASDEYYTAYRKFQIEMFFDGKIRVSWRGMYRAYGLVGLSEGMGMPIGFEPMDVQEWIHGGECLDYALNVIIQGSGTVSLDPN
ncbi:MAG: S8 family serine peptidase, partial [Phycisphaerae bacterium]|nr:S8 family serine peptidase [Phycisphaerae bacterium]